MNDLKFSFDTSFQKEILQFAVTDLKYGFKAVALWESHYFTLVEHSVIAEALKRYYEKRYSVPSMPVLKEELRQLLRLKQFKDLVTTDEKQKINNIVRNIYRKPVKDPETIYEAVKRFAQFSALKDALEEADILNFNSYQDLSNRIHKAINLGTDLTEDKGMFLLADAKSRTVRRQDAPPGYPTPWWQLNQLLNSGGTNKGNIIVLLAPAKRFKTGFMLNTAIGYLKKGRVILYADLENGEEAISMRADQAIIDVERKDLLLGGEEIDTKLLKKLRLYKRFGGELIIRRFPAGSTAMDISKYITWVRENHGLIITDMICDYPDIMDDIKKSKSDVEKISNVYIDLKNLARDHDLNSIWCPSHVNREGDKAQGKKFKATDIAKAMDKVRHADIIMGMQQDENEKEAGIIRVEMVDVRDGISDGRIWLKGNLATQRVKEFSKQEVKQLEDLLRETEEEQNTKGNAFAGVTSKKEVSDV